MCIRIFVWTIWLNVSGEYHNWGYKRLHFRRNKTRLPQTSFASKGDFFPFLTAHRVSFENFQGCFENQLQKVRLRQTDQGRHKSEGVQFSCQHSMSEYFKSISDRGEYFDLVNLQLTNFYLLRLLTASMAANLRDRRYLSKNLLPGWRWSTKWRTSWSLDRNT